MWFCSRGDKYRIHVAESLDGVNWSRKGQDPGIDVSTEGWDSEMIEYPCVFKHNGKRYMLYAGKSFGRTGFRSRCFRAILRLAIATSHRANWIRQESTRNMRTTNAFKAAQLSLILPLRTRMCSWRKKRTDVKRKGFVWVFRCWRKNKATVSNFESTQNSNRRQNKHTRAFTYKCL